MDLNSLVMLLFSGMFNSGVLELGGTTNAIFSG